ncbi:DUF333 domain-containing protein [Comamonas sp. 26]|uniref:putative hemolysin n=1 Tax=Comamonas sp. 26 TaxID=2035201 RepID=UPI0035182A36
MRSGTTGHSGYSQPMNKLLGSAGAALATMALAGCAQDSVKPTDSPVLGMANPASVYCVKIGGKLRIEKTPQGEQGICVLPNGTEMDEWTLFRRDHSEQK